MGRGYSFLSIEWRRNFVRTYLERDIPQFGARIPAETLRRFWTMLTHNQAQMLNAAKLAAGLGVDGKTVASYLDLLVDLLLVRRFAIDLNNHALLLRKLGRFDEAASTARRRPSCACLKKRIEAMAAEDVVHPSGV